MNKIALNREEKLLAPKLLGHLHRAMRFSGYAAILFSTLPVAMATDLVSYDPDLNDLTIEQLAQVRIYSANRRMTSIDMAPSVVTVVTDADIKRRGYKTLHELLGDVPGFHNLTVAAWGLLSNRGLVEDINASYLFLVDGHSMVNITTIGLYEEYRFPFLAKVKRVEIVRGPGSTLWGSDASMAVINIITKDGNSVDDGQNASGKFELTYDYEASHKRNVVDFIYGKSFGEDHDFLLTANYSNSNAPWTDGHIAGPNGPYQPSFMWFRMNQWDYNPSHDVFLKYRDGDINVEGGITRIGYMQPYYTPFDGTKVGSITNTRNWLDMRYAPQLNDQFKIETRLFGDTYSGTDRQWQTSDNALVLDYLQKVNTVGAESILDYQAQSVKALLGVFANHSTWKMNFATNDSGVDKNYAIFSEGTYSGLERLNLTVGARWEKNSGRTQTENVLPRFAAIYNIDPQWFLKYAYNTGVVRFGAAFSRQPELVEQTGGLGSFWRVHQTSPQKSKSHNIQLSYRSDTTSGAITIYKQQVTSIPAYVGTAGPVIGQINGLPLYYGTMGFANFDTYGVELEMKHAVTHRLALNGNAAYQHGRWDNRYPFGTAGGFDIVSNTHLSTYSLEPVAVPTYTWNLGVDYDVTPELLFNLQYRGNAHTHVKTQTNPSGFETWGLMHYVDLNLNYARTKSLEFSLYVKNLFDNNHALPHINSGYIDQYFRRQIGLSATVKF
jgi:outer membrane receptor for ferrienterochelin and colicin